MNLPKGAAGEPGAAPGIPRGADRPPPGAPLARPAGADRPDAAPLSEADFAVLRQALAARRPARRAARTAHASAVTTLVIGAIGLPLVVIWPSWVGALAVAAIFAIGSIEYVGAGRMRKGLPAAATLLGRNQLAFLTLIVAYCISQMVSFARLESRGGLLSPDVRAELAQLPGLEHDLEQQLRAWAPIATYGSYSLIILLSFCFQGGLALYYFTRKRRLEAVQRGTPAWIQRLFDELDV
jgi:hypothetical protein